MTCPNCGSDLYEQNRNELTGGTFVSIRCSKCNYFNYQVIPVLHNPSTTECIRR